MPPRATAPICPGPHYRGLEVTLRHTHTHTQTHAHTVVRTPPYGWSARRRDLYVLVTTHNTHYRQTSMPPAGFVPAIARSERPQTNALDRAVTGIGRKTEELGEKKPTSLPFYAPQIPYGLAKDWTRTSAEMSAANSLNYCSRLLIK